MAQKVTKEEKQRRKERKKQRRIDAPHPSRFQAFMGDWGRVVVPVFIAVLLLGLKYFNVIGDAGLGAGIGLILILGSALAIIAISLLEPFPGKIRLYTLGAVLLMILGGAVPFIKVIYPGAPVFKTSLTNDHTGSKIKSIKSSGYMMVSVQAPYMDRPSNHGSIKGAYRITFDKQPVAGELHDRWHQGGGRKGSRYVEDLHSTDISFVNFKEAPKNVRLLSMDPVLRNELKVSVFKVMISPVVALILLLLALAWAAWLDTVYTDFTVKMRFAPWVGATIFFVGIFVNSYEPTTIASQAFWGAILGGIIGFVAGWAISLIPRMLYARHRRGVPAKH